MGTDPQDNDDRQSKTSNSSTTAVATGADMEASRARAAAESVLSDPSDGEKGGLAMISTTINDHLGLFRWVGGGKRIRPHLR